MVKIQAIIELYLNVQKKKGFTKFVQMYSVNNNRIIINLDSRFPKILISYMHKNINETNISMIQKGKEPNLTSFETHNSLVILQ